MNNERKNSNELVLSDGEYAYTQDNTSGIIKSHTGPLVINITGQEIPVIYDGETGRFKQVKLEQSTCQSPLASQGSYCVLWNPAQNSRHPEEKGKNISPELSMGQRVNIPGPCTFSLWPRQRAKVIEGHHLRSNQYLLVRIYDEEAARANWSRAVVKPAAPVIEGEETIEVAGEVPRDLSVGRLIVIRGTEVSFYIPPTGVEVAIGESGEYVRDALTLERLEYCILIDEDGNKRYERGPAVVFPKPTEHFYEESVRGQRIRNFRPIELNPIQGIHVKVIAEYTDEASGKHHSEGDELFITGKDTPIYFPRQEHSLVSYDGRSKHFAVAVPAGEARYVMVRQTGEVRMVNGPTMLLPNPCEEVIVRRALTARQCGLWYPSNNDAQEYNKRLRELAANAPTTRSGVVSEGQIRRGKKQRRGLRMEKDTAMEASATTTDAPAILADEFSRGSTYTEPRTLTLHTRFAGVPTINIWTGYAVMVVGRTGERRVELGPKTVILAYDESLEVVSMSTGRPKKADRVMETPYLRMRNNQVSDVVRAETQDHVRVTVALSLKVNFEGEPERWFQVENYVQFLCDHVRSKLKGQIRKLTVEAFYADSDDIIRDALLGQPVSVEGSGEHRPGLVFEENGTRTVDVDILSVVIGDERIAGLLDQAQHQAVQSNIELAAAQRKLEVEQKIELIVRERATAQAETEQHKALLELEQIGRGLKVGLELLAAETEENAARLDTQKAKDAVSDAGHDASLLRKQKNVDLERLVERTRQELQVAMLEAETQATVARLAAVQEGFSEALLALGNQDTLVKVADALSVQQILGGRNLPEVVGKVFAGTPLDEVMRRVQTLASPVKPNGHAPHLADES